MNLKFETIVQIFRKKNTTKCSHHLEEHQWILLKNYLKKWPQNGPLSCYVPKTSNIFVLSLSIFFLSSDDVNEKKVDAINKMYSEKMFGDYDGERVFSKEGE